MHQAQIPQLDKSNPAEKVTFNGVTYRLMGSRKYYLSQSTTNEGRKAPKGLHVAIWEFFSGKTVPQGFHIHHKDGNTFNNEFSNLECLSRNEHCKKTNYKTERVKNILTRCGRLQVHGIEAKKEEVGIASMLKKGFRPLSMCLFALWLHF